MLEDARMRCPGDQEVARAGPYHVGPDGAESPARCFSIVGDEHLLRVILRLAATADADNRCYVGSCATTARFGDGVTIAAWIAGYLDDVRRAERRQAATAQLSNRQEQVSPHGDAMHDLTRRKKVRIERVQPVPANAEVKREGRARDPILNLACTAGSALANIEVVKPRSVITDRRL